MVIVVLGPMGCGKTTIGKILAAQKGWQFFDADDFHPQANKEKMAQGIPLDDDDRRPWLEALGLMIEQHVIERRSMILACSALKKKYRRMLGIDQKRVFSVFLRGSYTLLEKRISGRSHEYMAKELLQSQLDTLEEPQSGLTVDIGAAPEEICRRIWQTLPLH